MQTAFKYGDGHRHLHQRWRGIQKSYTSKKAQKFLGKCLENTSESSRRMLERLGKLVDSMWEHQYTIQEKYQDNTKGSALWVFDLFSLPLSHLPELKKATTRTVPTMICICCVTPLVNCVQGSIGVTCFVSMTARGAKGEPRNSRALRENPTRGRNRLFKDEVYTIHICPLERGMIQAP